MDGRCACRAPPYSELRTRPEVGSSALAAWLASRVATVKCSGPCKEGRLFYLRGHRVSFQLDPDNSMISFPWQARQSA